MVFNYESRQIHLPKLLSIIMPHTTINPAIHYWGTPVVLITTQNPDGSTNIGPMSSAWWLGKRCMLGLASSSQTTINLLRTKQCVLNLPSDEMIQQVNALARTTGSDPMPDFKVVLGYRSDNDKFKTAGLTPAASELVQTPRIEECPVQMEAEYFGHYEMMTDLPEEGKGFILAIEVKVLKTYIDEKLKLVGHSNRVDPDLWRPMIMSFQYLFGLKDREGRLSTLANIKEELYGGLDP